MKTELKLKYTSSLIGKVVKVRENPEYIEECKVDLRGLTGYIMDAGEFCPPIPFAKIVFETGRVSWLPVSCLEEI
jgi:hypothetical protein